MDERLRRLADIETGDIPTITVYLDMRPEATGESPGVRSGSIVLKDRLREIRRTFLPRGEDLESFDADAERITAFADRDMDPRTEGLAIFACNGHGIFEVIEAAAPFENSVTAGSRPDLYQLVRHNDEFETAIAALVDTNTARVFVMRSGGIAEAEGRDDDAVSYRKRSMGGWSQARYQRHIDKHRRDFTGEMASVIAAICQREGARHVILAGDEVAITPLMDQLPARIADDVRRVLRIDMRANINDVRDEVAPVLREIEAEREQAAVARLMGEVRRGGLGVAGVRSTIEVLERGQADQVIIDEQSAIADDERSTIVRLAAQTNADVEVIRNDERLLALGGVGALLRYRA